MGLFGKKTLGIGEIIEALASMTEEDKAQIMSALAPAEAEAEAPATEETTEEAEATEEATEEAAETVEAVEEAETAEAEAETAEDAPATEETAEEEKIDLAGIDAKIAALDEVIKALAVRIENIEKGAAKEETAEELFGIDMAEGIAAAANNEEESLRKEVFGF